MRSLRRLSTITFLCTALLLGMLLIAGYSQNRMMDAYNTIVKQSESTIFLFSTIREQTTEALLTQNASQIQAAAREIEQLHGRYTDMLESRLIPGQYKISFLKEIDLEQVAIDLRSMAEAPTDTTQALAIVSQLRQINNQFLQFDRIVVSEMKNRVMGYQKKALVLMGLIVALTSFTLIILYKKSVKPLIILAEQSKNALVNKTPLELNDEYTSSIEVKTLISSFNHLLQLPPEAALHNDTPSPREAEFFSIVNEVTNRLNGIINYSQLLADYCEAEKVGDEQKEILYKIMENGEKSAKILQKSLHGGEK